MRVTVIFVLVWCVCAFGVVERVLGGKNGWMEMEREEMEEGGARGRLGGLTVSLFIFPPPPLSTPGAAIPRSRSLFLF
jgi:hypothetical protein